MKRDRNAPIEMAYNTQLEELIIPEYGRNVQQLVRHAQTIPNREYRQAFCEEIVTLIQQLYPQSKNIDDYREKLWKHLFRIAQYKLDATTPSGITPTPEDARKRPEPVPYPTQDAQFRHYGHNVHMLIDKALSMPEGPVKEGFVQTIGAYMKLAYRTWNREHYVSDDLIKSDLELLSKGKLILQENSKIENLATSDNRTKGKEGGRDNRDKDRRKDNRKDNRSNNNNNKDNFRRGDNRNNNRKKK